MKSALRILAAALDLDVIEMLVVSIIASPELAGDDEPGDSGLSLRTPQMTSA